MGWDVGDGVDTDGICYTGMIFFVTTCCAIFVGVQVMFEVREAELRKGIDLKC